MGSVRAETERGFRRPSCSHRVAPASVGGVRRASRLTPFSRWVDSLGPAALQGEERLLRVDAADVLAG